MSYTPFQKYLLESVPEKWDVPHGWIADPIGQQSIKIDVDADPPPIIPPQILPTAEQMAPGIVEMLMELFNNIPGGWPDGWTEQDMIDFLTALVNAGCETCNPQVFLLILQLLAGNGGIGGIHAGEDWEYPEDWPTDLTIPEMMMLFYQILAGVWTYAEDGNWAWMTEHLAQFRVWFHRLFNQFMGGTELPDWYWDVWGEGVIPHDIP